MGERAALQPDELQGITVAHGSVVTPDHQSRIPVVMVLRKTISRLVYHVKNKNQRDPGKNGWRCGCLEFPVSGGLMCY